MSIITELLNKEQSLNDLLNSSNVPEDIKQQFKELFTNQYYKKTTSFLSTTFFAGIVNGFTQENQDNEYKTLFTIDSVLMFHKTGDYEFDEIGTMENSGLLIKGNNPFPYIKDKFLRNILMDEENKEIAFIFYDYDENNHKKDIEHISYSYTDISFIRGTEYLYESI